MVSYETASERPQAERLARRLALPLEESGGEVATSRFRLFATAEGLCLEQPGRRIRAIRVDFDRGKNGYRQYAGGGRNQLIARAVGIRSGHRPVVVDLTAGLGQDAYVLATLGCRVTLVERSAVVAALLRDGLQRGASDARCADVVARMEVVEQEGRTFLEQVADVDLPEVCYLDPMYPDHGRRALPGREMQLFRALLGDDEDSGELLEPARAVATRRVVVKRPRKAATLTATPPHHQIEGKSTRYDVYLTTRQERG